MTCSPRRSACSQVSSLRGWRRAIVARAGALMVARVRIRSSLSPVDHPGLDGGQSRRARGQDAQGSAVTVDARHCWSIGW